MPLPGDPEVIQAASDQLATVAASLRAAHGSVAAHGRSATADWTGLAAPLALARVEQDAADVQAVAGAATRAVAPLATYADELRAAQQDYARGEQMMTRPRAAYDDLGAAAGTAADDAERAIRTMDDARSIMDAAEERALVANETAARALEAATATLPEAHPTTSPAAAASSGAGSTLAEMGNAAASLGNAALRNPLDGLAVFGGGLLATAGAAGAVASIPLDASGVGLVVGGPLGGASVAGIAGGVGIAGAGLVDLATHAASDSRVTPFQVNEDADEAPDEISGMTRHGQERADGRDGHGVSDEAMAGAVSNPTERPEWQPETRTYRYTSGDAVVMLNERGEVVTTWATNSNGWRTP